MIVLKPKSGIEENIWLECVWVVSKMLESLFRYWHFWNISLSIFFSLQPITLSPNTPMPQLIILSRTSDGHLTQDSPRTWVSVGWGCHYTVTLEIPKQWELFGKSERRGVKENRVGRIGARWEKAKMKHKMEEKWAGKKQTELPEFQILILILLRLKFSACS